MFSEVGARNETNSSEPKSPIESDNTTRPNLATKADFGSSLGTKGRSSESQLALASTADERLDNLDSFSANIAAKYDDYSNITAMNRILPTSGPRDWSHNKFKQLARGEADVGNEIDGDSFGQQQQNLFQLAELYRKKLLNSYPKCFGKIDMFSEKRGDILYE